MKIKRIAVIGAGGTGHAIAADLTLAGFDINLYEEPQFGERVEEVLKRGGIEIKGAVRQGFGRVNRATTEIKDALEGADVILVSVVAPRHERIAELCAPYLKDGQTILVGPDNAGSIVFANVLKKMEAKSRVSIAGIAGNFYSCRLIGPAQVLVALPRSTKRIAAFPAKDTVEVINKLEGTYDFKPGTNVLEIALSSPNVVIHLAASLLNTGAIERSGGVYYLYRQGITPSVLRCIDAVKRERSALFKALGYTFTPSDTLEKVANERDYPELEMFRDLIGPTSMQHRYITEDASTGIALMVSLGR